MDSKIENKIDMIKVIKSICDKQLATLSTNPAFVECYNRFLDKLEMVDNTVIAQIAVIKGITEEKQLSRTELVKISDKVAQALLAYAHLAHDLSLKRDVHFSVSTLMRMRDELLIKTAQIIHQKATLFIAEIAPYGVNAVMMANLLSAIKSFELKCPEPREAIETRKTSTAKLNKLSSEITDLLRNELDRIIHILPDEHADFKSNYINSRNIIDYHGRGQKPKPVPGFGILFGVISNSEDNGTLEDAEVTLIEAALTVKTDEEGGYYFEKVPAGIYTIKVSAYTYVGETIPNVEVLPGAEVNLDIALNSDEGVVTPIPPVD